MPDDNRGSYPFTVWSGLLTPNHIRKIGPALAVFLWCIDRTTEEVERDGVVYGLVYGGRETSLDAIAADLGLSRDTISSHLGRLEAGDYITKRRTQTGLIIEVLNSKKWRRRTRPDPEEASSDGDSEIPRFGETEIRRNGDSEILPNPGFAESDVPSNNNDKAMDQDKAMGESSPPADPAPEPSQPQDLARRAAGFVAWLVEQGFPRAWTREVLGNRWSHYMFEGMADDALKLICAMAVEYGKDDGPAYAFSIADRCLAEGALTAEAVHARRERFRQRKAQYRGRDSPSRPVPVYRNVMEQLRAQGVELGDDGS